MALIKNIEEFQRAVGVNSSSSLEAVMGDILLVEDELVTKYLSRPFYEALHTKYQEDEGSLTTLEMKLLAKLQVAIANLAQDSYLAINQVQISDGGIHINSTDTRKTAFKWQIQDLHQSFLKKGYNGLERVLEMLEENFTAAEFALWTGSAAATLFHRYFINSSSEFSDEYNIYNSRLAYLNLLPILKKEERFSILPVLGDDLFEEIKQQIKGRALSVDNKKLLESFIRPALAHLVVAKALVQEGFRLTPNGIEIVYGRQDDKVLEKEDDNSSLLNRKIREAHQDGQAYLVKLKNYLNATASATKYAAYFSSSLYVAPGTPVQDVVIRNTNPTAKTYRSF